MSIRNILKSSILIKQVITITSLIAGVIGFSLSILSLFFPWYLVKLGGFVRKDRFIYYPFNLNGYYYYTYYSLLFGGIYGLLMVIISIFSWKEKKAQTFSSLIIFGILSFSIIIEYIIRFHRYPRPPCIGIPEVYITDIQYLIGYYLNLIAIILILFMIGVSFLGFFLYEKTLKKSRNQRIGEINSFSLYSILLLTAIIIYFIHFKISLYPYIIADPEVSLILITIVMFSITILSPKNQYKSLIPSFLIIYFVMILLRLFLSLKYFLHWDIGLTITHFFFFEIILILLIFSFIFFEKAPISLKEVFLEHKISRVSKIIHLLKILESIIAILLIYALIKCIFYGDDIIILIFQEFSIFLLVLYPIFLLVILSLIIYGFKEDRHDLIQKNLSFIVKIKKRKLSKLNNLILYIVIFLLTIYFYLILCLCNIIPEDMKVIIIERNIGPDIVIFHPEIFIFFVILNIIPLIIFFGFQKLKSVGFRNRLPKKEI